MGDILFKTEQSVFSYRVAGILIRNGRVLMQKTTSETGYAFPGGHAAFGETSKDTLIREFKEETGADILVKGLAWVAEIFFPWNGKPCQQICLFYSVELKGDNGIPPEGMFAGKEDMEFRETGLEFHWIPLDDVKNLEIYPENAKELLFSVGSGVNHFVYRER